MGTHHPLRGMLNIAPAGTDWPCQATAEFHLLPVPREAFSQVVLNRVLSLYEADHAVHVLREAASVLRPGGVVWVIEWDLARLAHRYQGGLYSAAELNQSLFDSTARHSCWDLALLKAAGTAAGLVVGEALPEPARPELDLRDEPLLLVPLTRA